MKTETREIILPFSGFYCSVWESMLDHELSAIVENDRDRGAGETCLFPEDMPDHEAEEIILRHSDCCVAWHAVARDYVAAFSEAFGDATGNALPLSFVALESPRFYNFRTDRIVAAAPVDALRALRAAIGDAGIEEHARDVFRARDGFIPFSEYKGGDVSQWPEDVAEWDHNMTAVMVEAALLAAGSSGRSLENDIFYDIAQDAYRYTDDAIDWPAVEAAAEEWQAETEEGNA
jgi:hypothetical protein